MTLYVKRKFIPILFLLIIASIYPLAINSISTPVNASSNPLGWFNLTVIVNGSITNLGDKPLPINQTDLLIFDYPINMSTQKVIGVEAFVNGSRYPYKIEGPWYNPSLVIEAPKIENASLMPGQTVSSMVIYNVSVNVGERLLEAVNIKPELAGGWSEIPEKIKNNYTGVTPLWNYSNPLINLYITYIRSLEHSKTPLGAIEEILNWFDKNVKYKTRIPARQPWETLMYMQGDCDDQSNLLITVLRGLGIPAYLEIGLVYISGLNITSTAANGLLIYRFVNGGSHAWTSAYVPPWGWIRIDLTASLGIGLNHIKGAAYYIYPTIVISRIYGQNYAAGTAKFTVELVSRRIEYRVTIELIPQQKP